LILLRIACKTLAWLALATTLLLAGYLWKLDRTITETFEGRRWSVPAVVFAQPLEIYPGLELNQAEFISELTRVGYEAAGNVRHPGQFKIEQHQVKVHLRSVQFVESQRPTTTVTVAFNNQQISTIRNLQGNEEPSLRLDPAIIGSFFPSHGEDRVILTPEQVPALLRDALKAIEDRSFDSHHGFDLRGIARAFLVNLQKRKLSQGGSTLTQQLVKSYFLDNRRTLQRKMRELAMAVILEVRF
jgi:penicillin-binding protein 1B